MLILKRNTLSYTNALGAKYAKHPTPEGAEELLKAFQGFIKNYKFINDKKQGQIRVYLKYDEEGERVLTALKRVSRCSGLNSATRHNVVSPQSLAPSLAGQALDPGAVRVMFPRLQSRRQERIGAERS